MKIIVGETEQQTAIYNLLFILAKNTGIIWLVKRIPFLELKPQYKMRDENREITR